ncbi:hypothetical protein [Halococcus sp. AFM35]|uniref:hypothetical protein n=1 Tax=Halococcus sp. AFM35 TaxID=3421653 RepID=UPI003EBA5672
MSSGLDVPDEFDDWPFEAKAFVLAEANTTAELRKEICGLAGLSFDGMESDKAGQFTKDEMATLVMALGGPDGDSP